VRGAISDDRPYRDSSVFYRLSQRGKCPVRYGNLFHLGRDNFEDARLQDHLWICCMYQRKLLSRPFEIVQQVGFAAP
jgi:hypothetical protein